MIQPATQRSAPVAQAQSYGGALSILTTLFFMWGFITVLNDILVPHLKGIFELNYTQIMLIQFTFFFGLFHHVVSLVADYYGAGISEVDCGGTGGDGGGSAAVSAGGGHPFVSIVSWGACFVLASGVTLLQVAANPYVAELGAPEKASSRLTLAQALNSLGTTIGPKVGGLFILSAATMTVAQLHQLTPRAVSGAPGDGSEFGEDAVSGDWDPAVYSGGDFLGDQGYRC